MYHGNVRACGYRFGLNDEQIDEFWCAIETPAELHINGKQIFAGSVGGASWARVLEDDIIEAFAKKRGYVLPESLQQPEGAAELTGVRALTDTTNGNVNSPALFEGLKDGRVAKENKKKRQADKKQETAERRELVRQEGIASAFDSYAEVWSETDLSGLHVPEALAVLDTITLKKLSLEPFKLLRNGKKDHVLGVLAKVIEKLPEKKLNWDLLIEKGNTNDAPRGGPGPSRRAHVGRREDVGGEDEDEEEDKEEEAEEEEDDDEDASDARRARRPQKRRPARSRQSDEEEEGEEEEEEEVDSDDSERDETDRIITKVARNPGCKLPALKRSRAPAQQRARGEEEEHEDANAAEEGNSGGSSARCVRDEQHRPPAELPLQSNGRPARLRSRPRWLDGSDSEDEGAASPSRRGGDKQQEEAQEKRAPKRARK